MVDGFEVLDPELRDALASFPEGVDPAHHLMDMGIVRMLRSTPTLLEAMGRSLPTDDSVRTEDRIVSLGDDGSELLIRLYDPRSPSESPKPLGAVVFVHGGAFMIGDVYSEELRCLRYAAGAQCLVISVGYRLAPEDPFPAAADDAYRALQWVAANAPELAIDASRIAIAGSSAGGALAAATALRARDLGGPPLCFQLLVYPVLDDRMETVSMRSFDGTPIWTSASNADMWAQYLGPDRGRGKVSVYAAPARAEDLRGLPSAYVLTAELDPLRDEGIDYARRLMQAGISTELHCLPGACHGFDAVAPDIELSKRSMSEQAQVLRDALVASGRSGK